MEFRISDSFTDSLDRLTGNEQKAVKQTANSLTVKEVKGQKWQWNPVAKMWYFLKAEKDRFSTLNQGTGSYVFDIWLMQIRKKIIEQNLNLEYMARLQMHDEHLSICKKEDVDTLKNIFEDAMKEVNKLLKLNIVIEIDTQVGKNYADVH